MSYRSRASYLLVVLLAAVVRLHAVTIYLGPGTTSLRVGTQQTFTVSVWQTPNKAVTWAVNGVTGGNAALGRVTVDGVYTAPAAVPAVNPVTLTVKSVAEPLVSASASITVLNPVPAVTNVTPQIVQPGPVAFMITGSGFTPRSQIRFGGLVVASTFVSSTRLIGQATASLTPGGRAALTVTNPDPGMATSAIVPIEVRLTTPAVSALAAARFLEQISWGPDPASIQRVQQLGFEQYLNEQFGMPASTYPNYPDTELTLTPVQRRFLSNTAGPDQLRQRVAFALSQIFVVSGFKNFKAMQFVPHIRLLHEYAFTNFGALLREVTLSPSMGIFLDLTVNEKANPYTKTGPNENFARELLQLFTIGTERLNLDGTLRLQSGRPIPAYDQDVILEFSRALTGWTFPTKPGATPQVRNPPYFVGRLEPSETLHDTDSKILLNGVVLPAGLTPQQDLDAVLSNVFSHPNVGPFIARRLIQHLVMSNPSPAYVARVATAFNGGATSRGDMRAVIRAVVLDPEARRGDIAANASPFDGHLREPILYFLNVMRALGGTLQDPSKPIGLLTSAGQQLFYPPSVFNYFAATRDIPGFGGLRGPEFEVFTPSAAVFRANVGMVLTFSPEGAGVSIDPNPFEQFAAEPSLLVEAANRALLFGRLSPGARQSIEEAVTAIPASVTRLRVQTALFLVATSTQYQVQR